jgi:uncharacterized protein YlbG (UPF0298 family)
MKLFFKIIITIIIIAVILLLALRPKHDPKYYYNIISSQEVAINGTKISEKDKKILLACKNNECFRSFFDDYTMKNGPEKAFSYLITFQNEFPDRGRDCHYISHGIGHATLRLNNNNIKKTFDFLRDSGYIKNIATCGNGFFHGAIEELSKTIKTKEELTNLLATLCSSNSNCYHGSGHAAAVQLIDSNDSNVSDDMLFKDAFYVCDSISTVLSNRFECYTGIFMQETYPSSGFLKNNKFSFVTCDKYPKPYQTACYLEQSTLFESVYKESHDYVKLIGYCRQINDQLNRMACVKLFAIRAVRVEKFNDIHKMCLNTSTKQERVMCTAVVASKIAGSIDDKSINYDQTIWDVCSTAGVFSPLTRLRCFYMVKKNEKQLFFTSDKDFETAKIFPLLKNLYDSLF